MSFGTWGLTANRASVLGALCVVAIFACFCSAPRFPALLLLAPVLIFFRFVMNALDGLLSRAQNTASAAGELANEILDVLGDGVSYAGLLTLTSGARLEFFVLINAIWLCEFIAVVGKSLPNGRRRQESFLGGKPERAVFLAGLSVLAFASPTTFESAIGPTLLAIAAFTLVSAILRARAAIRAARGHTYNSDPILGR